jgi:tRNA(Ile2) C34 agmatinyltransferase TiaS
VTVPRPGAEPVVAHSGDTGDGGEKRAVAPMAPKTLRLDKFLAGIPQAHSLQEGRCPYCNSDLEKTPENAYLCRRCNRLIRAVEPSVRRA